MKKLFYLIIFCLCLDAATAQSIVTEGELAEKQNDYYFQPTFRNGVGVKRSIPISTLKSFIHDSLSIALSNKQAKFDNYTNEYGFLISQRITPPFNPEFTQEPYQVISFIDADDSNLKLKLNIQEKLNGSGFLKLDGENISYDTTNYAPIHNAVFLSSVNLPYTTSIGTISNIELSYIDGVTSAIQTQLNSKLSSVSLTTNVTGILPASNGGTGISSLGPGIATFLGTPSSTNLLAALTTKTGTGNVVFSDNGTHTGTTNIEIIANTLGANFATTSGNVGVGTNAPYKKFVISDAGNIGLEISPNDGLAGYNRILSYNRSTSTYADFLMQTAQMTLLTNTATPIILSTNSSERLRIDSSGKVGIGTASPVGAVDITSTTGALIVPRMTAAQRTTLTGVNGSIVYQTDATSGFYFYDNGAWVKK